VLGYTAAEGGIITHRILHVHFACVEQRARDLDGIEKFPTFRVRVWAKDRPAFSIRQSAQRGRRVRHTARQVRKARRQPVRTISVNQPTFRQERDCREKGLGKGTSRPIDTLT